MLTGWLDWQRATVAMTCEPATLAIWTPSANSRTE
jgi:hypothetical protein